MGERGPQPILKDEKALASLKYEANLWANLLFVLRDGKQATIAKVEWGPYETRGRATFRCAKRYDAVFLPLTMSQADLKKFQFSEGGWQFEPPIIPQPQVWEALKLARTAKEARRAAHDFDGWLRQLRLRLGYVIEDGKKKRFREQFPTNYRGTLDAYAKKIRDIKRLWNYPKKSDDKRIVFFSKTLAGLSFGLAPATAQHRLLGWRFDKKAMDKSTKEHFERLGQQPEQAKFFKEFRKLAAKRSNA